MSTNDLTDWSPLTDLELRLVTARESGSLETAVSSLYDARLIVQGPDEQEAFDGPERDLADDAEIELQLMPGPDGRPVLPVFSSVGLMRHLAGTDDLAAYDLPFAVLADALDPATALAVNPGAPFGFRTTIGEVAAAGGQPLPGTPQHEVAQQFDDARPVPADLQRAIRAVLSERRDVREAHAAWLLLPGAAEHRLAVFLDLAVTADPAAALHAVGRAAPQATVLLLDHDPLGTHVRRRGRPFWRH